MVNSAGKHSPEKRMYRVRSAWRAAADGESAGGAGKSPKMAPPADQPFFAASTGAAAALLGLLFVAVSVAPESTVGAGAPVERQMVAESVFTALIDAFFVSMGGTVAELNLGSVAFFLSAFALFQTTRVAWKLWPRRFSLRAVFRRLALAAVALGIYGVQFADASQLIRLPSTGALVGREISVLFALYAFALGRSWELLGARRGILAGRLSPISESDRQSGATAPPTGPLVLTEAPDVAGEGTRANGTAPEGS